MYHVTMFFLSYTQSVFLANAGWAVFNHGAEFFILHWASCLFCGWWLSRRHPIISVLIMQVADSLLHDESSNLETLMFCSQTLRSKVKHAYIDALCYFLLSRNLLISVTLNDLSWICLHFRCKEILRSYRQKLFDHCKTLYM